MKKKGLVAAVLAVMYVHFVPPPGGTWGSRRQDRYGGPAHAGLHQRCAQAQCRMAGTENEITWAGIAILIVPCILIAAPLLALLYVLGR